MLFLKYEYSFNIKEFSVSLFDKLIFFSFEKISISCIFKNYIKFLIYLFNQTKK